MSASFDYAPLQATALRLLTRFGRPSSQIVLRHPTLAAIPTVAVFVNAERNVATPGAQLRRDAGSAIELSAFYVVPDVGVDLDTQWWVDDDGSRKAITRVRQVKPGNVTLVSRLYVGA